MAPITDHPLRYMLANELHARPFPTLTAPCRAAYLALKPSQQAANRDKEAAAAAEARSATPPPSRPGNY